MSGIVLPPGEEEPRPLVLTPRLELLDATGAPLPPASRILPGSRRLWLPDKGGGLLVPTLERIWPVYQDLQQEIDPFRDYDDYEFQRLIGEILTYRGYQVFLGTRGPDGGIDLRAFRDGDSGQEYVVISAKRYSGPVGVRHVRELSGVVERDKATRGLLVTSSRLTKPAAREIEDQCFRLGAADGKMLLGWVQEIVGQYGLVSARL